MPLVRLSSCEDMTPRTAHWKSAEKQNRLAQRPESPEPPQMLAGGPNAVIAASVIAMAVWALKAFPAKLDNSLAEKRGAKAS